MEPLDHDAVRLAVTGLRGAYERNFRATRTTSQIPPVIAASAVEFVNWACALDEVLRTSTPWTVPFVDEKAAQAAYGDRRDAHEDGRVIPGLRHVRDRHMHQVITSHTQDDARWFGSFPPQLSLGTIWRPVEELGEPPAHIQKRPNYTPQRESYRLYLQRRPPVIGLLCALRWLTAEIERRGCALPDWPGPNV